MYLTVEKFGAAATFRSALHSRLQTAITSSFQIQITQRLKRWIPDFPRFKMKYHMHNLSSRKCFKNVSNRSKIFAPWTRNFAPWIEVCENGTLWTEEFAPCFARCENDLEVCEMALVCQEVVSHGAKFFAPWIEVCEIDAH